MKPSSTAAFVVPTMVPPPSSSPPHAASYPKPYQDQSLLKKAIQKQLRDQSCKGQDHLALLLPENNNEDTVTSGDSHSTSTATHRSFSSSIPPAASSTQSLPSNVTNQGNQIRNLFPSNTETPIRLIFHNGSNFYTSTTPITSHTEHPARKAESFRLFNEHHYVPSSELLICASRAFGKYQKQHFFKQGIYLL